MPKIPLISGPTIYNRAKQMADSKCLENFNNILKRQHDLMYGETNLIRPRGTVLTLMDDKSKIVLDNTVTEKEARAFGNIITEWQENYLAHYADRFNIFEKDEKINKLIEDQLEDELLESVQKETPKKIQFDDYRELTKIVANAAKEFYMENVVKPIRSIADFQKLSVSMDEFWKNAIKMNDIDKKTAESLAIAKQKRTIGTVKSYNFYAHEYNKLADRQNELLKLRETLQDSILEQMIKKGFRPLAFYTNVRANAFEPQLGELKPFRENIINAQKKISELEGQNDKFSKNEVKNLKKIIKVNQEKIKEVDTKNRQTIKEHGISEDFISSLYLEKPKTINYVSKKPEIVLVKN